jgi:hypothetical protein
MGDCLLRLGGCNSKEVEMEGESGYIELVSHQRFCVVAHVGTLGRICCIWIGTFAGKAC